MNEKQVGIFYRTLYLCLLFILCAMLGNASAEQDYTVSGTNYTLPEDSDFDYSGASSNDIFFYGAQSLGELKINGAIEKNTIPCVAC